MSNVAISALPAASAATSADLIPIVQSGTTQKLTNSQLFANPALAAGTIAKTATASTDITNKNYVDAQIAGLNAQIPCAYGTTGPLTATYSNGTAGVGATLTATTNGALSLDGGSPTVGMRILVKDQTTTFQNGVFVVADAGSVSTPWILSRAADYDQTSEINAGDGFYIDNGTTNKNTIWVQQTPAPVTVGTTAITFLQFGAGGATGLPKQPYTPNTALYANSATSLTLGVLPAAAGGTGASSLTANSVIVGNGTSAVTGVAPGASGNVLTSNGTTWASTAPAASGITVGKAIAMSIIFGS
jgi:hypothetical protein